MAIRVFVNGLEGWLEGLRGSLRDRVRELGLADDVIPVYSDDAVELPARSVVLYFGCDGVRPATEDEPALVAHLEAGRTVIPVLDDVVGAEHKVPACLHALNGFGLGVGPEADYSRLVSEVIDRLWHLRPKRKVFISYRRVDSAGVARQLRSALGARGYEVFLDESTIRAGADFQRDLEVWLNDADFVLLLASPRLGDSTWVMHEIEFANLSYVGILALCWPTSLPDPVAALMPDQKHLLAEHDLLPEGDDLAEQELAPAVLAEILSKVDRYRARAIHQRLVALLPFFQDAVDAARFEIENGERLGDVRLRDRGTGKRALVRVLPFRPTVSTLNDLYRELAATDDDLAAVGCYYAENDVNDPGAAALEWALRPERPEDEPGPRRYRLLRYSSQPLRLDELL